VSRIWSADCTCSDGEVYVSDEPDRERVRALLAELDKVQRESERLREKIANLRRHSPEYPAERDAPDPADTASRSLKKRS
jgi:hypothetical protein